MPKVFILLVVVVGVFIGQLTRYRY